MLSASCKIHVHVYFIWFVQCIKIINLVCTNVSGLVSLCRFAVYPIAKFFTWAEMNCAETMRYSKFFSLTKIWLIKMEPSRSYHYHHCISNVKDCVHLHGRGVLLHTHFVVKYHFHLQGH